MKITEVKTIVEDVDHLASKMELKWGVERLRLVVTEDLRKRFDRQRELFNDALFGNDAAEIRDHGSAMIRAYTTMDEQARVNGFDPLKPEVWEARLPSGKVIALVRSNDEAHNVVADGRHTEVWTIEEIARLIEGPWRAIGKCKEVFPGALVADAYAKNILSDGVELNDAIPF